MLTSATAPPAPPSTATGRLRGLRSKHAPLESKGPRRKSTGYPERYGSPWYHCIPTAGGTALPADIRGDSRKTAAAASNARLVLLACSGTHLVTDGLIAAFYPLLPLMADDLHLSYTAVGSLRTMLRAGSSVFQLPVGILADRVSEIFLLGAGMLWLSLGFAAMALAGGFWSLMSITTLGAVGGNAQHPLGSAIVSRLYDRDGRATAISTLNFSGDLGKMIPPAIAGLAAVSLGWRGAVLILGVMGIAVSMGYALSVRRIGYVRSADAESKPGEKAASGWGISRPVSFALISTIGIIDDATRSSVLTFLPFLMAGKGLDAAKVSLLLTLIFACGAAGKLGCGLLADRFGNVGVIVITEGVTALAILAVVPVDPLMLIPVLAVFGFVLNGTSSAIYSTVAELVHVDRRARGYGLFYTLTLGVGTVAPILYGLLADSAGIVAAFATMAGVLLTTIPLAAALRASAR